MSGSGEQGGPARMLVLEDDAALSEVLCDELRELGHPVEAANSLAAGQAALQAREFDVALLDLMLPDGSGIDLLRTIASEELATEAIVLTGYAAVSTAIEAMKLGAYDYLTKPVRMDELEVLVAKAAEKARLRSENVRLRAHVQKLNTPAGIVTSDTAMLQMLAVLERVAQSDLPVLIQGETGTGKELVARAVHQRSERSRAPFVAVNCAAVPEQLLESELFGYERGAFTGAVNRKPGLFEMADRGVLFLDEIGDLSPRAQGALLRVLENRTVQPVGETREFEVDVAVVLATNRDLDQAVRDGSLRPDFHDRFRTQALRIAPLRERPWDVPALLEHFRLGHERRSRKRTLGFSREALQRLVSHSWPGNVREIDRTCSVLVTHARLGTRIDLALFERCAPEVCSSAPNPRATALTWDGASFEDAVTAFKRELLLARLEQHEGDTRLVRDSLGLAKTTFHRHLAELGISLPPRGRAEGTEADG